MKCRVEDCLKEVLAKGLCSLHYQRLKNSGTTDARPKQGVCSAERCEEKATIKGLCKKHYSRVLRTGGLEISRAAPGESLRWLMDQKQTNQQECLIWPFGTNGIGYGLTSYKEERLAHRIMCEEVHGEPTKQNNHALHSCGNGHLGCINPNHLYWGNNQQNAKDRITHGRSCRGELRPTSVLTEKQVKEIKQRLSVDNPPSKAKLAKEYGVSIGCIDGIKYGTTWAWLEI